MKPNEANPDNAGQISPLRGPEGHPLQGAGGNLPL